jgi:hypothetical protein
MVDGRWMVKERKSLVYDHSEIAAKGKEELTKLLKRIQ